ncbi:MAG TPA: isocitrate lyase/phosphoenolpyruvate mutase family protein [Acidimicrobiia bacterium]|nr:isocitrate lyase/phosphoenolpyruvate mutase family protein [Acidimicrobiia bacterium]
MTDQQERAEAFWARHSTGGPLLLPNPWDRGSAVLLTSLGFEALATTSSGSAATLARRDGALTRDEALEHAASIVGATDLPVSADFEDGFTDDPAGVAETIGLARQVGLAGCSVEDYARHADTIYDIDRATERVAAAADAAHRGARLVLTARAENFAHGQADLADTITRLQRYQEAGADVLFAPGLVDADDLRTLVAAVDRPVNVLALEGCPPVATLSEIGVRRISVGGGFAFAAYGAAVEAATELRDQGTYGYRTRAKVGATAARAAFPG